MEIRQAIKMYLDCMASQDAEFAVLYANKDKNLDECLLFIEHTMYQQAKEKAEKDKRQAVCLAPSDDEVFSLAVRYYYDTDLKVEGSSFDEVKLLSMSATSFTDEEKEQMRREAIERYQAEVIAEAKKRDEERKQKKQEKTKKPASPVIVPDNEQPTESHEPTQQLSLFDL